MGQPRIDQDEKLPIFQSQCQSLLKYQDRDTGMWYQIVDKPTAPKNHVETSCSLRFAHAMARAAQRGRLAPEYHEHALRAARDVLNRQVDLLAGNRMDIRGMVQVGSLGGDGGFYDYHVSVPVVTNDQKSIGAFMHLSMALSEIADPAGAARSRRLKRRRLSRGPLPQLQIAGTPIRKKTNHRSTARGGSADGHQPWRVTAMPIAPHCAHQTSCRKNTI